MDREASENVEAARRHLGDRYEQVKFVEAREAGVLTSRREELLAHMATRLRRSAAGTKPHIDDLSPGCVRCQEGTWSCLFVNSRCGADCFFCPGPAPPGRRAVARAETLEFDRVEDYSEYVGRFGYRAVSFSGGDPLLSLESVLDHLRHLRRRHGDRLYVWLYTNGIAADEAVLERLREAGLDEIRFNIAATGYALDRVALATGILGRVTIEIPAIPEDVGIVRERLVEMSRIGVRHLNLHQLMMIGGNHRELTERGYRFSHGLNPPVAESELAALSLLEHAVAERLDLSIHYCSWAYKARWQVRARDAKLTGLVRLGFEGMSGRGLLRRIWVEPPGDALGPIGERLQAADPSRRLFLVDRDHGRVYLRAALLGALDREREEVRVAYYRPVPIDDPDQVRPFPGLDQRQIRIDSHRTMNVRTHRISRLAPLGRSEVELLERACLENRGANDAQWIPELEPFERMPSGLPDYV